MTIAEALENVGAEVAYINPGTRVVESRGTILGVTQDGQGNIIVHYPEGDHPTRPDSLKLRSKS